MLALQARVDVDLEWPATPEDISSFNQDEISFKPQFVPDLAVQNAASLTKQNVPNANLNEFNIKVTLG